MNPSIRKRARELRIAPGILPMGKWNSITDVRGVKVGHVTLIEGDDIRTGVTAILPHDGNLFQNKVPAAIVVGNGFGKLARFTQVEELGEIETPIILTNTLSVPRAAEALVDWTLAQEGNEHVLSVNPVVGETNDGRLNNIRKRIVTKEHVLQTIGQAASGPVAEGCVGAGTGTICYGWKGGIGTSSRVLSEALGGYTVGVLVQTNFGGVLQVDGLRRFIGFWDSVRRMYTNEGRVYTKDLREHPEKYQKELAMYKSAGSVWISYAVPFIIPITAGLVTALVFGDLLFALMKVIAGGM